MRTILIAAAVLVLASCSGNNNGKGGAGTELWTVGSEQVDCMGVGRQRCYIIKPEGERDWQLFYSQVDGFDYEPGYEYVISVKKQKVDNPPMDASSYVYSLGKVVSREKKTSENIPDTSHMFQ